MDWPARLIRGHIGGLRLVSRIERRRGTDRGHVFRLLRHATAQWLERRRAQQGDAGRFHPCRDQPRGDRSHNLGRLGNITSYPDGDLVSRDHVRLKWRPGLGRAERCRDHLPGGLTSHSLRPAAVGHERVVVHLQQQRLVGAVIERNAFHRRNILLQHRTHCRTLPTSVLSALAVTATFWP